MKLNREAVIEIIKTALKEDIGPMDVTTTAVVPKTLWVRADILTKDEGIICGLPVCEALFELLSKEIKFKPQVNEGNPVHEGKAICYIEGPAGPVLTGERTALNFLARMSGIATETDRFVQKCKTYGVKVMDTRKTAPGLRYLDKYAVSIGGGHNHRIGLWDQVLIKDNHLKAISCHLSAISKLLKNVRGKVQKNTKIEIEIGNLDYFKEALKGKPDIIMLDNMQPEDIKKAVEMRNTIGTTPLIEVSGNIGLDNVEKYAGCRPDIISVGSITHSFRSLDMSLEVYG